MRTGRFALAVAVGIGLGALVGSAIPVAAGTSKEVLDRAANLPDPVAELASAEQTMPFTIHLPSPLPDGSVPLTVETDTEGSVASVGMWWALAGSSRFHIWETNNQSLATEGKDVLASGVPLSVDGVSWQETRTVEGTTTMTELCRQFPDSVILCVASDLDATWVSSVAATIQ